MSDFSKPELGVILAMEEQTKELKKAVAEVVEEQAVKIEAQMILGGVVGIKPRSLTYLETIQQPEQAAKDFEEAIFSLLD
jgi:hypothetical protein